MEIVYPISFEGITFNSENEFRTHLLSLMKYYKGEAENPYANNSNDHKGLFWSLEDMYIKEAIRWDDFHQRFINYALEYIKNNPNENNYLTSNDVSIEKKAIVLYCDSMIGKWMPYNQDIIFEY